jgi:hypothetical protein
VATQRFSYGGLIDIRAGQAPADCPADTDLTLQYGWLSLTQQQWLTAQGKRPRDVIGLSVRTSYDPIQMRAKGFIYIAADVARFGKFGGIALDERHANLFGNQLNDVRLANTRWSDHQDIRLDPAHGRLYVGVF